VFFRILDQSARPSRAPPHVPDINLTAPASSTNQTKVPGRSIAFLAMASFVSAATLRAADPLLPAIGADFGGTTGEASIVVTAFSVSYGVLQAFYGPVGDLFGKYRIVALASFLSAITVIICALAPSLTGLTLARLASGATAAAIIPLSMAWIGDAVPYEHRQPVLAKFLTGQIMGFVFGQAAGGIIGETLGWRAVFLTLAFLFVIAGTCLVIEIRRPGHTRTQRKDVRFGPALIGTFLLFKRRWVRIVIITVLLEGFAVFGAFAFVASDLQHRFGIGPGLAGALVTAYGFGGLAYALGARRLVPILGEKGLAIGGGLVIALAFLILAISPTQWLAPPATFLAGLGFYMLHNTLQTNATQMVPEARGAAVALFASGLFIGQTLGVALIAPIFDRHGGWPAFVAAALFMPLLAWWFGRQIATRERPA
jgi:predicted MFS family arabinose efflux permease